MRPEIDKVMVKKIKEYDPALEVEWDDDYKRWAIKRLDEAGVPNHIFYHQNKDGSYSTLDERVLEELYECDIWRHFEKPGHYHDFIKDKTATAKLKAKDLREEYLKWWNKDHRKEWKEALENAQRGIFEVPEAPSPRKIII